MPKNQGMRRPGGEPRGGNARPAKPPLSGFPAWACRVRSPSLGWCWGSGRNCYTKFLTSRPTRVHIPANLAQTEGCAAFWQKIAHAQRACFVASATVGISRACFYFSPLTRCPNPAPGGATTLPGAPPGAVVTAYGALSRPTRRAQDGVDGSRWAGGQTARRRGR